MNLSNRRESSNIEDRRGKSGGGMPLGGINLGGMLGGGGKGRLGCGTIILVLAFLFLMSGGDLGKMFQMIGGMGGGVATEQTTDGNYRGDETEEALALFTSQILASTEDVWTEQFQKMGRTYQAPTLVMYTGSIQTGCGNGSAAMGPFYCSADQKVYIDLSFFRDMKQTLGADGDFAYAYVIAHEVGHHVQNLLGDLGKAHQQMARLSSADANQISVQIELQADFYAGFWGHHEQRLFHSMERGDLEEALVTAQKIGDDYLQKKAQGYSNSKTYTHGTSAQRERWFRRGWTSGDLSQGDTFSVPYSKL